MAKRKQPGSDSTKKEAMTTAQKILAHFNPKEGQGISLSPKEEESLISEVDSLVEKEVLKFDGDVDLSTFEFGKDVFKPAIAGVYFKNFDGNMLKQKSAEKFMKSRISRWQDYIRGVQRLKLLQQQLELVAKDQA